VVCSAYFDTLSYGTFDFSVTRCEQVLKEEVLVTEKVEVIEVVEQKEEVWLEEMMEEMDKFWEEVEFELLEQHKKR